MSRHYVISDLHITSDRSRPMLSEGARTRLAKLVTAIPPRGPAEDPPCLVLAGDIIDYLGEPPFRYLSVEDALAKTRAALDRSAAFWHALREFRAKGGRLVLMVGNHDLELSFADVRRELYERVGSCEFLVDGEAFSDRGLLVEHGNRYDSWNLVSHSDLRELRSSLSRGEHPPEFLVPPGSAMVIDVINPLKADYPFVDLLKPEVERVLPILAVLDPSCIRNGSRVWELQQSAKGRNDPTTGKPYARRAIGAPTQAAGSADGGPRRLARELATGGNPRQVGNAVLEKINGIWSTLRAAGDSARGRRDQAIARLRKALVALREADESAFRLDREEPGYLAPAKASIRAGFKVVVYGHTHLCKDVSLDGGGRYLNSGTWVDLMRLPRAVQGENGAAELESFLDRLVDRGGDSERRLVPTFVAATVTDDHAVGELRLCLEDGHSEILTQERWNQLWA
jgi:UDP-2,3-diacylglucosamine pyrophosphatase LpxH